MTLVARSTPNFSLPATQNTAPVHEFRCLYTHDVRKKAKKWHDGSVRFHTFNKRVMVYDDARNYIGDLHYRADEGFGEGVELHLDRGVLVEVGERMGETHTDLTGIVNKPHTDHTMPASSMSARTRPVQRASHLNSQGKPRSLTELLGASQGRMGRAMLPVTSPFEQRQALVESQPVEPPSKRQKIGTGKENDIPGHRKAERSRTAVKSRASDQTASCSRQPQSQRRPNLVEHYTSIQTDPDQSVIELSSDDEAQNQKRDAAKTGRTKNSAKLPSVEDSSLGTGSTSKDVTRNPQKCLEGPSISRSSPSQITTFNRPVVPQLQINTSTSSASRLKPGMTSLKMVSQKPRRRLVYKALLPSSNVVENVPPRNTEVVIQDNRDASHEGQHGDTCQTPPAGPRPRRHDALQTPPRHIPSVQTLQQTPLFVSQAGSQRSPTPERSFVADDFTIPSTQQICDDANLSANAISDEVAQNDEMDMTEDPESPCFPMPPPRSKPTPQSLPAAIPRLEEPPLVTVNTALKQKSHHTPSPKKSRQFTRSLSANDSPLPHDPRASPSVQTLPPIEESPLNAPLLAPPKPLPNLTPVKSPTKSPLQRSRSDTAAIIPTTVAQPEELRTPEEQGPWTALEAFLLFDKWPMCKQKRKPVFEPLPASVEVDGISDSDNDNNNDYEFGTVKGAVSMKPVMIRSARSFLRNGG